MMDTSDSDRSHSDTEVPSSRWGLRWWIRLISVVVALALFGSALGYLTSDRVSENEHFDRLHSALVTTRHSTAEVASDLADLRRDVAVLRVQVGSATTTWTQDTAQVKAAQFSLAVVQDDVSQRGSRIGALQTCLGGVQQALNALAINDQTTAVSELNSVAPSCAAASGG